MQRKIARLEESVTDWLHDYAASELGKGGGDDDDLPPLRLNYPKHYVLHAWSDYIRHGIYPKPGGYDAQDTALIADFNVLTAHYNRIARELQDDDSGGERDMDTGEFAGVIGGIQQTEWRGLIGE